MSKNYCIDYVSISGFGSKRFYHGFLSTNDEDAIKKAKSHLSDNGFSDEEIKSDFAMAHLIREDGKEILLNPLRD